MQKNHSQGKIFLFAALLIFIVNITNITVFAQEPCPGVTVKDGDRRANTNRFAIARQLSFPDPFKIHSMFLNSQLDPAVQSAAQKMELDNYLKANYSGDPDVIISDDMTTCDDLLMLRKLINDEDRKSTRLNSSHRL